MKHFSAILFLSFLSFNLVAQEVTIPKNIKLETEADYKKSEPLVLKSIEWIQKTPLSENAAKRKELNGFLIQWMSGSPNVSIEIAPNLVPMDAAECLMAFMSGWAKYSLENNYSKDKQKGAMAGVERMIAFYENNKSQIGKTSAVEKLIKRKKKGKLEKYVSASLTN